VGVLNEVEKLGRRVDRVDDEQGVLRERIGATNEKLARLEEKMDTAKDTVDKIDDECAKEQNVADLKRRVNWLVGLLGTAAVALTVDLLSRGVPS
jgi:predicted RNase H-like nuclease (RuvC/YqgF family)